MSALPPVWWAIHGGTAALVDADMVAELSKHSWRLHSNGYAVAGAKNIRMHRLVLSAPAGVAVDHINRDRLDNRRANLRLATASENQANSGNRTQWRGVYANAGKFEAKIKEGGKLSYLGRFDTPEEAARRYDDAAALLFGPFAVLNYPVK